MTKWEFQQIVQRDMAVQIRNENEVGLDWLKPLLEMEAEEDRHQLILFCSELAKKVQHAKT
jgi:hypothetical protein